MSSEWRKQTKARKSHQCEICRGEIVPGEVYVRYDCTPWGHPDNEGYHTYRCCRFCDHMHYDVINRFDDDDVPYFDEDVQEIREHFYYLVSDAGLLHPETDIETYTDNFSRWTLAGGPFERCVGHPDGNFESILPGLMRCPKCAAASAPGHNSRSFYIASAWNAVQRFYRQYPRYLPEPISYEVALDLLRDSGVDLNGSGRVEQILDWFGDTDNVRRAIETVRGESCLSK